MRLLHFIFSQLASLSLAQCIEWSHCEVPGATLPLQCGTLVVPLDYTDNTSEATLTLDLRRVPAAQLDENGKARKGSILFNFGGPGASGLLDMALFAERLQAYVCIL